MSYRHRNSFQNLIHLECLLEEPTFEMAADDYENLVAIPNGVPIKVIDLSPETKGGAALVALLINMLS